MTCRVVGEIRETRIRCGGGVRLLVGVDGAGEEEEEGEAAEPERGRSRGLRNDSAEVAAAVEEGEVEGTEGVPFCGWRDGVDPFSETAQVQVQGGIESIVFDAPPFGRRPSASLDRERRRTVFRLESGREARSLAELVAEDAVEDDDGDGGGDDDDARSERSFVLERAEKGCADSAGLRRTGSWGPPRGGLRFRLCSTPGAAQTCSVLRSSIERITSTMLFLGEVGGDRAASPSIDVCADDTDA
jgi:hypothetical protein